MKILHVPRRFVRSHWGGTETVILEVCKELAAHGHDVRIVTSMALAATRAEELDGIRVERYPHFYPWLGLSADDRQRLDFKGGNLFSFGLWRALRGEKDIDVLHLHTGKRMGGIVRDAARRRGIPYVVSLHGGLLDVPAAEAATFAEPTAGKIEWGRALGAMVGSRRVMDDAAAILCLGDEELKLVGQKWPGKRVVQLPNGVHPGRFETGDGASFRARHGIPADAEVILVMGRIDPQKNQLLAVEAMQRIARERPKAHLLLVGHVTSTDYEAKVRAAMDASTARDHITLIPGLDGSGNELVDAYHAADVFLLPSIHEPFGIVILEAWAAGRAVVASRVGGVPSFVVDGTDGLLFESGSDAGAADAITAVLANQERRAALAQAGLAKARDQFSWEAVTRQLETLYEEVVRAHPPRK